MPTTLDAAGMRALIDEHSGCELDHNWEGALATMIPAPHYEFYPYRLRISGAEAITEMWSRIFSDNGTLRCFDIAHSDLDAHEGFGLVGDDSIVDIMKSVFRAEDGEIRRASTVVWYRFEDDRMMSETLWVDATLVPYLDTVFDESFRALPGVETI